MRIRLFGVDATFLLRSTVGLTAAAICAGMVPATVLPSAAAQAAPPSIRVIKFEQLDGAPRKAIGHWAFTLSGPDTTANDVFDATNPGPTIERRTNENGRGNWIDWRNRPAGDYRLCEQFWAGWKSNLGGSSGYKRPNGSRCVDFSLSADATRVFRVNNICLGARRGSG